MGDKIRFQLVYLWASCGHDFRWRVGEQVAPDELFCAQCQELVGIWAHSHSPRPDQKHLIEVAGP